MYNKNKGKNMICLVESSMMGDSFLEKIWCSTEITNLRKKEEP